jgi:glycosyltransferase involved in cell wall biosynthesis
MESMTIWYDVSDLADWRLSHFTGIQRVVAGVLRGLLAGGVDVRLVRFDSRSGTFDALSLSDLPVTVREFVACDDSARAHAGARATPASAVRRESRWRAGRRAFRDALLGQVPEASALRTAMRDFDEAWKQVRRQLRKWTRARAQAIVRGRSGASTVPTPCRDGVPGRPSGVGPIAPGDVLISLGATWIVDGHPDAVAGLRAAGVHVVRMIYDMIPALKPQWMDNPAAGIWHSRPMTEWARRVLAESDLVLTISEFSRREIERYCRGCGLASAPVSVVRLGDELARARGDSLPLPRFVPRRPFMLCVCTIDLRKNHRMLYDAWTVLTSRSPERCPDLLCVGVPHIYVHELMREITTDRQVNGHIHFLSDIPDVELEWYYRHCLATVYPSRYEGWGLPVAESLARGRLVLSSNAASMPEISGDLPCFFDPLDVYALVGLVERVVAQPDWVRQREGEIRDKFAPTLWSQTAEQVMQRVSEAFDAG